MTPVFTISSNFVVFTITSIQVHTGKCSLLESSLHCLHDTRGSWLLMYNVIHGSINVPFIIHMYFAMYLPLYIYVFCYVSHIEDSMLGYLTHIVWYIVGNFFWYIITYIGVVVILFVRHSSHLGIQVFGFKAELTRYARDVLTLGSTDIMLTRGQVLYFQLHCYRL